MKRKFQPETDGPGHVDGYNRKTASLEHPLKVRKVEVNDSEYKSEVPIRMRNKNFPGFPSCSVFVGMPGSGKSNCFMHMMLSEQFWNDCEE